MTVDDPYLTVEAPPLSIHQVWRDLLGGATEDQIVEPDPQISLDYVVGGLASAWQEREQARAERLIRPPGPSDEEIQREVDRVMSLGLWKLRQNPCRHAKRRGPRTKRRQFWCPPGCYAAQEASRLDDLVWTFHITLTAPRGAFWASWEIWDGLRAWEALTDRMEYRLFWLLVFARQPETGETHAHLLVGNLNRDQVDKVVAEWPWPEGVKVSPITNKAGGRWAVIHYVHAQTLIKRTDYATLEDYYRAVKREHRRDVFSYYPAVVWGPLESDNLDLLLIMARYRIAATAARKVARRRQGDSDWGRAMAARRWKKNVLQDQEARPEARRAEPELEAHHGHHQSAGRGHHFPSAHRVHGLGESTTASEGGKSALYGRAGLPHFRHLPFGSPTS